MTFPVPKHFSLRFPVHYSLFIIYRVNLAVQPHVIASYLTTIVLLLYLQQYQFYAC